MKYKLCLLVLCAGLQGSVQAEGGFFSGVKNKMFGWFGKEQKPANATIQGPVKRASEEELAKMFLDEAVDDEVMKERLCNKYSNTAVCQERAEVNAQLIKILKTQKQSLGGERFDKFEILEKKAQSLTNSKLAIEELCKRKPEIQEMLNELFPGRNLSCEQYVRALKVKSAKETVQKENYN